MAANGTSSRASDQMTPINLPYIHRFRDRHGKVRHYVRKRGCKPIALRGEPGSEEFVASYREAIAAAVKPKPAPKEGPGTIGALIASWRASAEFRQLSRSTQQVYRRITDRLRQEHGHRLVGQLPTEKVRKLVAEKANTPAAGNHLLRILRLLMRHAIEDGWRKDDPTIGVRRLKEAKIGIHSWTEEEIAAFEEHWPSGTKQRLAMALLLYTGQRRSDVVRMGRQHIRGGKLDVAQRKTKTKLAIPLHPELANELDRARSEHLTFLVTEYGAPFTAPGFYNVFKDWCRSAGLPHCSPHGLRKAAARRLAEAGCTAHEIASITGHRTLSEVARYTMAADQVRLAEAAIARIKSGTAAHNPIRKTVANRKKSGQSQDDS